MIITRKRSLFDFDLLTMTTLLCICLLVCTMTAAGWVMNIVQVCHADSLVAPLVIVKLIGIFVFILGAIMGWVDFL